MPEHYDKTNGKTSELFPGQEKERKKLLDEQTILDQELKAEFTPSAPPRGPVSDVELQRRAGIPRHRMRTSDPNLEPGVGVATRRSQRGLKPVITTGVVDIETNVQDPDALPEPDPLQDIGFFDRVRIAEVALVKWLGERDIARAASAGPGAFTAVLIGKTAGPHIPIPNIKTPEVLADIAVQIHTLKADTLGTIDVNNRNKWRLYILELVPIEVRLDSEFRTLDQLLDRFYENINETGLEVKSLTREDIEWAGDILNRAVKAEEARLKPQMTEERRDEIITAVGRDRGINTLGVLMSGTESIFTKMQSLNEPQHKRLEAMGVTIEELRLVMGDMSFGNEELEQQINDQLQRSRDVLVEHLINTDAAYATMKRGIDTVSLQDLEAMITKQYIQDMISRPLSAILLPVSYWYDNIVWPLSGAWTMINSGRTPWGTELPEGMPTLSELSGVGSQSAAMLMLSGRAIDLLSPNEKESRDFLRIFDQVSEEQGTWDALGYSFENYDGNGFKKFATTVLLDPTTYFGFGIYAKIFSKVPKVGPLLAGMELGYMKGTDALFLGVKRGLYAAVPKTIKQVLDKQTRLMFETIISATEKYVAATTGRGVAFRLIPLDQIKEALRVSMVRQKANAGTHNEFTAMGKILRQRAPATIENANIWRKQLKEAIETEFDEGLVALADDLSLFSQQAFNDFNKLTPNAKTARLQVVNDAESGIGAGRFTGQEYLTEPAETARVQTVLTDDPRTTRRIIVDERGAEIPEGALLLREGIWDIDTEVAGLTNIIPGPNARTAANKVAQSLKEIDVAVSRAASRPVQVADAALTGQQLLDIDDLLGQVMHLEGGVLTLEEAVTRLLNILGRAHTAQSRATARAIIAKVIDDVDTKALAMINDATSFRQLTGNIYKHILDVNDKHYRSVPIMHRDGFASQKTMQAVIYRAQQSALGAPVTNATTVMTTVWADKLDMISRGTARLYLMFMLYTPFNIMENGLKTIYAGLNPIFGGDQVSELSVRTIGLNHTEAGRLLLQGEGSTLELGNIVIEQTIRNIRGKPLGITSDKAYSRAIKQKKAAYARAWGFLDEMLIKKGARIGAQQQANYVNLAMVRALNEEFPELMTTISRTINAEAHLLSGMDRKVQTQLIKEANARAVSVPESLTSIADDYTPGKVHNAKVRELISEYTELGPLVIEHLLNTMNANKLFPNLTKIFDDEIPELIAQHVMHSPELARLRIATLLNELTINPPKTAEEFASHVQQLGFITEQVGDITYAQTVEVQNYAQDMLNLSHKKDVYDEMWNKNLIPFMEETELRVQEYVKFLKDAIEGGPIVTSSQVTEPGPLGIIFKADLENDVMLKGTEFDSLRELIENYVGVPDATDLNLLGQAWAAHPAKQAELVKRIQNEIGDTFTVFRGRSSTTPLGQIEKKGSPGVFEDISGGYINVTTDPHIAPQFAREDAAGNLQIDTAVISKHDIVGYASGSESEFILKFDDFVSTINAQKGFGPIDLGDLGTFYEDLMDQHLVNYANMREARLAQRAYEVELFAERDIIVKEVHALKQKPTVDHPRIRDWWTRFNAGRDGIWEAFRVKMAGGVAETLETQAKITGIPVGTVDESLLKGEKLLLKHISDLFGTVPSDITAGLYIPEQQLFKNRRSWVNSIRERAKTIISQDDSLAYKNRTPDSFGFTTDAVGGIYDDIIADLGIRPETVQLTDPVLMQAKALKKDLIDLGHKRHNLMSVKDSITVREFGQRVRTKLRTDAPEIFRTEFDVPTRPVDKVGYDIGTEVQKVFDANPNKSYWYHASDSGPQGSGGVIRDGFLTRNLDEARNVLKHPDRDGFIYLVDDSLVSLRVSKMKDAQGRIFLSEEVEFAKAIPTKGTPTAVTEELISHPPAGEFFEGALPAQPVVGESWNSVRQRALDKAYRSFELDFPDYTSHTAVNAVGRGIFPFWTYETHRLQWLARSFVRTPGMLSNLGKYQDATDRGYIPLPHSAFEGNFLRGTIWMGGLRRLVMRDFPDYYDRVPWLSQTFDQLSRYGFYPNFFVTGAFAAFGAMKGGSQIGEVLPPLVQFPLEAYIFANPQSASARFMYEKLLPNRFRDYMVSNAVSKLGGEGVEILTKINAGLDLTDEEQTWWAKGQREIAQFNMINMNAGLLRFRPDERIAFEEAHRTLMEELTGIPASMQIDAQRAGVRLSDFLPVKPEHRELLRELEGYTQWKGAASFLGESEKSYHKSLQRMFWMEIEDESNRVHKDQTSINNEWRSGVRTRDWWMAETRKLNQRVHQVIEDKRADPRFISEIDGERVTIPLTLEERQEWSKIMGYDPQMMDAEDELIAMYYQVELTEHMNEETGLIEPHWDKFFLTRQAIFNAVTADRQPSFESRIRAQETDLEAIRRNDMRLYIRAYNQTFDLLLSQRPEEEQVTIRQAHAIEDPDARAQLLEVKDSKGRSLVSRFQSELSEFRKRLRQLDPEMDGRLVLWKGLQPATEAGAQVYRRLRREYGFSSIATPDIP